VADPNSGLRPFERLPLSVRLLKRSNLDGHTVSMKSAIAQDSMRVNDTRGLAIVLEAHAPLRKERAIDGWLRRARIQAEGQSKSGRVSRCPAMTPGSADVREHIGLCN